VNSQEAKDDGKTDRLNSVGWSQSNSEISEGNQKALNEESLDTWGNDTALTTKAQNSPQNKLRQTHDPTASNAHTEDIALDVAKEILSLIEKSP
jgi:hypothetical protein